jgi:hypothetical protein
MDRPSVSTQIVDERTVAETSGLAEEDADGRAVGDCLGIELLRRSSRRRY